MSFILDALKKLEKERQRGSTPDLTTVHVTEPQKHRKHSLWLYLAFAALAVNAGILALFFISRDADKKTLPAKSLFEHPDKRVSAVSSQTPLSSGRQSGPSETISFGRHDPDRREPSEPTEGVEKHIQNVQSKQIEQEPVRKHKSLSPSGTDIHIDSRTPNDILLSSHPSSVTLSTVPPATSPVFHHADPNKAASQQDIPDIGQLPQSVRSEIPPIKIFGHIYSDSPATRLVNINGNVLREGDNISKNIRLEKITKNGVIFAYGDIRFSIRAF